MLLQHFLSDSDWGHESFQNFEKIIMRRRAPPFSLLYLPSSHQSICCHSVHWDPSWIKHTGSKTVDAGDCNEYYMNWCSADWGLGVMMQSLNDFQKIIIIGSSLLWVKVDDCIVWNGLQRLIQSASSAGNENVGTTPTFIDREKMELLPSLSAKQPPIHLLPLCALRPKLD